MLIGMLAATLLILFGLPLKEFYTKTITKQHDDRVRAEYKTYIVDSVIQVVKRSYDQDFIAVVTYSDELGWTEMCFISGTHNYLSDDMLKEQLKIKAQLNGKYKIGQRFCLIPEINKYDETTFCTK